MLQRASGGETAKLRAFFDVGVFNPLAQSYRNTSLAQCYQRNELEKRRAYDERVREIEHGSFSPLVFNTSGGMGKTANIVYKRIASMIAEKQDKTLQQDDALDPMQTKFPFVEIIHHVPPWISLNPTSPRKSLHQQKHGPRLLVLIPYLY